MPIRLTLFFVVTGWAFLSAEDSFLHNSLVFTYGFVEIMLSFMTFTVLKEERNTFTAREIKARVQ